MRLLERGLAIDFVRFRGSTAVCLRSSLFCGPERRSLVTAFSVQPVGPIFSGGGGEEALVLDP
jgi:hypothetical protein